MSLIGASSLDLGYAHVSINLNFPHLDIGELAIVATCYSYCLTDWQQQHQNTLEGKNSPTGPEALRMLVSGLVQTAHRSWHSEDCSGWQLAVALLDFRHMGSHLATHGPPVRRAPGFHQQQVYTACLYGDRR